MCSKTWLRIAKREWKDVRKSCVRELKQKVLGKTNPPNILTLSNDKLKSLQRYGIPHNYGVYTEWFNVCPNIT
jgi:hypothetical protein